MTVQTRVHDGINVKTRTWRNVYKTKGLAEVREGFFAQREHSEWGVMIQLKGKERIILNSFGNVPVGLATEYLHFPVEIIEGNSQIKEGE